MEKNRLAFLDMLLLSQKNGTKISDENIQEEVDTFMYGVSKSFSIKTIQKFLT